MNQTAAYTPLECLLLFQSLVAFGTEEQDFDRISSLLTNNSLVKDGPTYDVQRLTSEALRSQYLQLLRDEVNSEDQDEEAENGSTSKKRKLPSPPLPSINDAREYKEKLPLLVDRLYARYRDYMVKEIREEEKRYATLKREIGEIERGEWDERFREEDRTLANGNGVTVEEQVQTKTNGAATESTPTDEPPKPTTPKTSPRPTSSQPEPQPERAAVSDAPNDSQSPPITSPRPSDPNRINSQPLVPPPTHKRTGSNGSHPSPSPSGPQHPGPLRWEPPYGTPTHMQQYPPGGSYPQYNSPQYASQPYPPSQRGFSSPNGLPPPHSTLPSSPGHFQAPTPVLLPPSIAGVRRAPGSPGRPLEALADVANQQHRAPSTSSMVAQQGAPPPQGYFQQYPTQQRPLSAGGPSSWPPHQPPPFHQPQAQYQAPPNQRQQFQPQPNLIQTESRHYNSPYNPSQGSKPQTQAQRLQSLPSTPISRGSPHLFTGSGTRWTPTPTGATPGAYVQIPRPDVEPLSPTLKPSKPISPPKKSGTRPKSPKAPPRGIKRTRAPSVGSSVVGRSRRSQSVMSHADELSMDNEPARRVKEEVATPAGISDTGDTTADDSTLPRPSSRAGPSVRQSNKRKRGQSNIYDIRPPTHVLWTRNFPNISKSALENISADKNASIFAAPVKERDAPGYKTLILRPQDLKSIRAAITAGHRAATAAAPEDMNPNLTNTWLPISEDLVPPKGIINNAQLEKELMRMFANAVMFNPDPNRGFGKRWQAMGAAKGDALGYAFDEDSVVKSTRAMFADVEKIVGDLRAAERRSEETRENSLARANIEDDEVDELAGDGESHVGSVAKRRRKA